MDLPHWERGTPAVLCTSGPHAIPVSTAIRAGGDRVLFALGTGRATLARLRAEPAVALCVLGRGVAFTAHGRAGMVREELAAAPHVAALELLVDRVQDHLADGRTEMLDGARWRWIDENAAEAEPRIVAELESLAGQASAG
jgi:hypothetical protein